MKISVTLEVPEKLMRRYGKAARQLRRVMGSDAPTEQVMLHQPDEGAPAVIAGTYLDRVRAKRSTKQRQ